MILRLWSVMRQPRHDKHPVFRRILLAPDYRIRLNARILGGTGVLVGMFLLCGLTYLLPARMLGQFVLLPVLMPVLLLAAMLGGTGKGIRLANAISAAISREHDRDTFTVLASLPGGKLGVYWLILTAHIHRNGDLENANEFQQTLTGFLFAGGSFLLLILYLNTWTATARLAFINGLFIVYPLAAVYYIDYVCSLVTGALIGALAATYRQAPREARGLAVGGFIALQFGAFALAGWLALNALPSLATWLGFNVWLARVSIAGLSVVGYYLMREAIAWGVWRLLTLRLGAAPAEQASVLAQ